MVFLELKNVSKTYSGEVAVTALDQINLKVTEGEFVSVMGPSGSGKTTLLNLIASLDTPTAGRIILDGELTVERSKQKLSEFRRQKLGFIFQNYNLLAPLTVEENIMLSLTLDRVAISEIQKRVKELLVELQLEDKRKKWTYQLSGGEQQRVAIARALVHKPKVLLADEPTGNLDSKSALRVMTSLNHMNRSRQVTTMMVTHDPYSASFSDRVVFIKDGQLYNEIYRGDEQHQFYQKILDVLAHLGGRQHDFHTADYS